MIIKEGFFISSVPRFTALKRNPDVLCAYKQYTFRRESL